jgi:hypothetical protein
MTPEERSELVADIALALKASYVPPSISDEELQWVRLAIKREAQSIRLREAIIEKTMAGLAWFFICAVGYLIADFARNHGFK